MNEVWNLDGVRFLGSVIFDQITDVESQNLQLVPLARVGLGWDDYLQNLIELVINLSQRTTLFWFLEISNGLILGFQIPLR